jgi:hypothetical protein
LTVHFSLILFINYMYAYLLLWERVKIH